MVIRVWLRFLRTSLWILLRDNITAAVSELIRIHLLFKLGKVLFQMKIHIRIDPNQDTTTKVCHLYPKTSNWHLNLAILNSKKNMI